MALTGWSRAVVMALALMAAWLAGAGTGAAAPSQSAREAAAGSVWLQGWTHNAPTREVWVKLSADGRRVLDAQVSRVRSRCANGTRPFHSVFLPARQRVAAGGRFRSVRTREQPGGDLTTRWRGTVTARGQRVVGSFEFSISEPDADDPVCTTGTVAFSVSAPRYEGVTGQGRPIAVTRSRVGDDTVETTVQQTCERADGQPYTVERRIAGRLPEPDPLTGGSAARTVSLTTRLGTAGGEVRVAGEDAASGDRCADVAVEFYAARRFQADDRPVGPLPQPSPAGGRRTTRPTRGGVERPLGSWEYTSGGSRFAGRVDLDTQGPRKNADRTVRVIVRCPDGLLHADTFPPIPAKGAQFRFSSVGPPVSPGPLPDPVAGLPLVPLVPVRDYWVGGHWTDGRFEGFVACGQPLWRAAYIAAGGTTAVFDADGGLEAFLDTAMRTLITSGSRPGGPATLSVNEVLVRLALRTRPTTAEEDAIIGLVLDTFFEARSAGHI